MKNSSAFHLSDMCWHATLPRTPLPLSCYRRLLTLSHDMHFTRDPAPTFSIVSSSSLIIFFTFVMSFLSAFDLNLSRILGRPSSNALMRVACAAAVCSKSVAHPISSFCDSSSFTLFIFSSTSSSLAKAVIDFASSSSFFSTLSTFSRMSFVLEMERSSDTARFTSVMARLISLTSPSALSILSCRGSASCCSSSLVAITSSSSTFNFFNAIGSTPPPAVGAADVSPTESTIRRISDIWVERRMSSSGTSFSTACTLDVISERRLLLRDVIAFISALTPSISFIISITAAPPFLSSPNFRSSKLSLSAAISLSTSAFWSPSLSSSAEMPFFVSSRRVLNTSTSTFFASCSRPFSCWWAAFRS
mmetsp:Transcript_8324/g.22149  ORF Transcript_8324/g.22149 Transcript_8324/m.22149 type:complete len:362 (-) Transcript_8324:686-1771(-)